MTLVMGKRIWSGGWLRTRQSLKPPKTQPKTLLVATHAQVVSRPRHHVAAMTQDANPEHRPYVLWRDTLPTGHSAKLPSMRQVARRAGATWPSERGYVGQAAQPQLLASRLPLDGARRAQHL